MSDELPSRTHVAGQDVIVEGRFMRQRCAWCGSIMLDYDLERTHSTDGAPPAPWENGVLVTTNGGSEFVVDDGTRPDDSCWLDDVPAATG